MTDPAQTPSPWREAAFLGYVAVVHALAAVGVVAIVYELLEYAP